MTELRHWADTEAGKFRERLRERFNGGPEFRRPIAEVDKEVEQADRDHREAYGRALTDGEKASVRAGAERRGQPFFHSPELGCQDYADLGWGFTVVARPPGAGIAIKVGDRWEGDPRVVARCEAAEAIGAAGQVPPDYLAEVRRRAMGVPGAS
jgi:hypothetical protein